MTAPSVPLVVTVNDRRVEAAIEPRRTLADFLREDLGLTGTHLGCEHGVCGACTVLLDGAPVRSCLIFAVQVDGSAVTTVESMARNGDLHPLQQAFRDEGGLQCGFCTPGMLLSALAFVRDHASATDGTSATDQEIREAIAGNLCRCTGYGSVVRAIRLAMERGAGG
jgi:carbon-monoxide dehydrogenase small subunit